MRSSTVLGVVMLLAASAFADERYTWRNVKVVAGGYIPAVVFSHAEKNLAYCRTDIGGCYRWDDKQQKWIPLNDAADHWNYPGGESIAPDPVDPDVVYMAGGMYSNGPAVMMRSRNRGDSWEIFPVSFRMGGNEDGRGLGERLAVDPNDNRILYFGSRHEGLWKSEDQAATWKRVERFPLKGLGNPKQGERTHAGLSFIAFDPSSTARGTPTKTIVVGSADPGEHHLFRSDDAGVTWNAIEGEPRKDFLPAKAEIDSQGVLFITYGNGIGPNGVTDGAVWKLDTKSNQWSDITPDKRSNRPKGGYCGLSVDRLKPGTLAVTTMNRWDGVDTVWRSTDSGATWHNITGRSERDVSLSPFLLWGDPKPKLGWWMSAFAIDPFDSNHACYATGATLYATKNFSDVSSETTTNWSVWADGIEETAVITLISPTEGAQLLSGFGDICGFVHDDFDRSPPQGMFANPIYSTTITLDYAGAKPMVVVRSGRPHAGQAPHAWSQDGGRTWTPLSIELPDRRAVPAIAVCADGTSIIVMSDPPQMTRDLGKTWRPVVGLPSRCRAISDRVDAAKWYAIDFERSQVLRSEDGGANFSAIQTTGLPADLKSERPTWDEAAWPLVAAFGRSGDLWFTSKQGLFHSTDGGTTFAKIETRLEVEMLALGKPPRDAEYPTLFAVGMLDNLRAIWRSDDSGKTWMRVNDDQHQYGRRFRCIAADPRIFGRVYVGTDGRGILYGEPVKK